ncbi:MAG: DNA-protecting protein DprA [Gammaproteobacteria bacterium]|nr:DNA-protecting protein DprA [Gammaproteobacteria bacterium]
MDTLDRWLVCARAPGLLARHLAGADAALGEPLALAGARPGELAPLQLPEAAAAWLARPDARRIAADRRWLEHSGAQLIGCTDARFPPLLATIEDAPVCLFVRGEVEALLSVQLAIVGTRDPTPTGRRDAYEFARHFARGGLVITSGLALGIDTAAHEGALAGGGRTVAVLGCGLDEPYPPENTRLAERIVGQGALVSEFPPGVAPLREHFPRRNRLISGLSLGVLVVEAARRSGSLITARLATSQGREVFALPGSIHNPMVRGCHALIRQGAKLVETAADILEELRIPITKHDVECLPGVPPGPVATGRPLDKDYEILLDALAFEPASIDALADRTGLPGPSVASMLLILELEGRVGLHPGGRYARLA